MSYGILIKTTGGIPAIESVYGTVPDGEQELTGHDYFGQIAGGKTVRNLTIAVTRRDPDGRYATSAHHTESREE